MKIKYEKGTPPRKGYYMVRVDEKYAFKTQRDMYPLVMYWNGEGWQDYSDEDAFNMPGRTTPIKFDAKIYPVYCEVEL